MSDSQSSAPESPWPVRELNQKVKGWIEKLGHVWVEGQITQVSSKRTWKLSYITLRDVQAEMSVQLTCPTRLVQDAARPAQSGDRVIVYGKPAFYGGTGQFSLWVTDIRPVGLGELLARIEQLRVALHAEGLFDPRLKRPLPFLPKKIGLVTSRGSAAERDVLSVATDRWQAVQFRVENATVQGANAVADVLKALAALEADPDVDVIIVARGGGSVEDLLPFSDEALVRAVSRMTTPVVSAIGHEPDNPLLDNVADLRAATPTDAAKRVVPDVAAELQLIADLRGRSAHSLRRWVDRGVQEITALRSRPVLSSPLARIDLLADELTRDVAAIRRDILRMVQLGEQTTAALRAQVSALGPGATLARGYAVVQVKSRDGGPDEVVTSIEQSPPGSQLRIRVGDGSITAATMATKAAD